MIGAIIGDLAGSVYEYGQVKNVSGVKMGKVIEDDAFISDDSILTIAIMDAIINKKDYGKTLREYVNKYKYDVPKNVPYFKTMFSPNLIKWAESNEIGKSFGNGAMMRVSPVGYLFNNEKEVMLNAIYATSPSHNTAEAVTSAEIIALLVYYFKKGYTKDYINERLNLNIIEPKLQSFNYRCDDTMDVCLYSIFNAKSFEDGIGLALSFGGDTDTNACIVGSVLEARYGVPEELKVKALNKLNPELRAVVEKVYENENSQSC